MVRKFKHHEQRLLRKVDFTLWPSDKSHRANAVARCYRIQRPEEYMKYNRLCNELRRLAHKLSLLPPTDSFRQRYEELLLQKLFDLGVLGTGGAGRGRLSDVENKVTVSAFCRRRLPMVMQRLGMAQTLEQAATYIEQQHVRVGVELVTDPAFLVSRNLEDFVTWVDSSKIKRSILKYQDKLDDFDLLQL